MSFAGHINHIKEVLSIPRSFLINVIVFGVNGVKIPLLISNNTKFSGISKGCVVITEKEHLKSFQIRIGFGGTESVIPNKYGKIIIKNQGKLVFENNARIASGSTIVVNNGEVFFGDNFSSNRNCSFSADKEVTFGKNCLLGWNVNVRDSDGHEIMVNGNKKETSVNVNIGNHVWLCSYSNVLKGSEIQDDSIVGYNALVSKKFEKSHIIIGGNPAKLISENAEWNF